MRGTEPYSHSRLSVFEKCPYRYRLQYIDKVEVEERQGIEAVTGTLVHECLEHVYAQSQEGALVPWEDLVARLRSRWDELVDDTVVVVKRGVSKQDYLFQAQHMLLAYYRKHRPFDQHRTVGLEHELTFEVRGRPFIGYIDRLSSPSPGVYEIHDYKTGKRLPTAQDLRADRQLALYELGVRQAFPDAREVHLVWHYLAYDRELRSSRTAEELVELERRTEGLIQRIENETDFPKRTGPLCRWCEYEQVCRGQT